MTPTIRSSPDLTRILALPRRPLDFPSWLPFAKDLSDALRTPNGTMFLRPVQALALHDAATYGGLFGPIGVGEGKTLLSLLVARVMAARRPLLLLPAALVRKTKEDQARLEAHWQIPNYVRLLSYDMLGRSQAANDLTTWNPDLIIADEVHRLKNRRAACTKRVARYMHEHPETRFVALSGTVMTKSLTDFAHILRWCLKEGAPVPADPVVLDEWAAALDVTSAGPGGELMRPDPGALLALAAPEDRAGEPLAAARRGFRQRLVETPGVVATAGDGERVDASILVRCLTYPMQPITERHYAKLRGSWETPDDWQLEQGSEVWAHARQLALGCHYAWSPRPPEDWRQARRAWNAYVRSVLAHSRTLDSPEQVELAVDAGDRPDGAVLLEAWRAIRPTFVPNTISIWHDDSTLELCARWAKTPGIVWAEHTHFARRLAALTGLPYYGEEGLTEDGRYIDNADPKRACIASIAANKEGRNLQALWSRNLVVCPPDSASVWQQLIARTHRPGQTADTVEVDVLWGCAEHVNAWRKATEGTYAIKDTVGGEPKLLLADIVRPSDEEIDTGAAFSGARWGKST